MCTAISVTVKDNYFGRNLDYEHTFGEKITITPRKFRFKFRNGREIDNHYAMIGMALPKNNYPLYFDASNEKGLSMAGLNFPENTYYQHSIEGCDNVASFEFIPWILSQCGSVAEAEWLISQINLTDEAFDKDVAPSPLHWLIADKERSITVEQTKGGMKIYDNPAGVLTNNPTFDIQLFNLNNYLSVSAGEPENLFSKKINLTPYSRGMGGIGLPGDLSSMSRFVRACFTKLNSVYGESEKDIISQFFHILYSVYQQKGCARVNDRYEITNYTSCCNTNKGIYYYTTYNNVSINAVDMYREDLNRGDIITYELIKNDKIHIQN